MNLFSTPKRLERGDIVLSVLVTLAVCLLVPNSNFEKMNVNWVFGLVIMLPFSFVAGLLSSWIYYGSHKLTCVDPFYIRAWWGLIGGAVGWMVCLLFRPIAADFSFVMFTFGLGPVLAFHVYHHFKKFKQNS